MNRFLDCLAVLKYALDRQDSCALNLEYYQQVESFYILTYLLVITSIKNNMFQSVCFETEIGNKPRNVFLH